MTSLTLVGHEELSLGAWALAELVIFTVVGILTYLIVKWGEP